MEICSMEMGKHKSSDGASWCWRWSAFMRKFDILSLSTFTFTFSTVWRGKPHVLNFKGDTCSPPFFPRTVLPFHFHTPLARPTFHVCFWMIPILKLLLETPMNILCSVILQLKLLSFLFLRSSKDHSHSVCYCFLCNQISLSFSTVELVLKKCQDGRVVNICKSLLTANAIRQSILCTLRRMEILGWMVGLDFLDLLFYGFGTCTFLHISWQPVLQYVRIFCKSYTIATSFCHKSSLLHSLWFGSFCHAAASLSCLLIWITTLWNEMFPGSKETNCEPQMIRAKDRKWWKEADKTKEIDSFMCNPPMHLHPCQLYCYCKQRNSFPNNTILYREQKHGALFHNPFYFHLPLILPDRVRLPFSLILSPSGKQLIKCAQSKPKVDPSLWNTTVCYFE